MDFYVDWLEGLVGDIGDGAFGLAAGGLASVKRKSGVNEVFTGLRPFPFTKTMTAGRDQGDCKANSDCRLPGAHCSAPLRARTLRASTPGHARRSDRLGVGAALAPERVGRSSRSRSRAISGATAHSPASGAGGAGVPSTLMSGGSTSSGLRSGEGADHPLDQIVGLLAALRHRARNWFPPAPRPCLRCP